MSLKSGTLLESSKLPYQYWFICIHLMTATKKDHISLGDATTTWTQLL